MAQLILAGSEAGLKAGQEYGRQGKEAVGTELIWVGILIVKSYKMIFSSPHPKVCVMSVLVLLMNAAS